MLDDTPQLAEFFSATADDAGEADSTGEFQSSTDEKLASLARAGDREALGVMFRRHHRRIFQVAFGIVRDVTEAEDVVQETFIRVCENFRSFKGECAFSTWTHRIALNLSLDALRRLSRRKAHATDDSGDEELIDSASDDRELDAQGELLRAELAGRIEQAADELGDAHRAIFLLREVDGLSYEELSEALRVPKGTVMSRLFHARRKMQLALEPYVNAGT